MYNLRVYLVILLSIFTQDLYASPISNEERDVFALGTDVDFDDLPPTSRILDGYKALTWNNLVTNYPDENLLVVPSGKMYARTPISHPANPIMAEISYASDATGFYSSYDSYLTYQSETGLEISGFYFACTMREVNYEDRQKPKSCSLTVEATGCSKVDNGAVTLGPFNYTATHGFTQVQGLSKKTSWCTDYKFSATPSDKTSKIVLNLDSISVQRCC